MGEFTRDKPNYGSHTRRQFIDDARFNLESLRNQMITGVAKKWRTNFIPGGSIVHYLYHAQMAPEPPEAIFTQLFMGSGASSELITSVQHSYRRDTSETLIVDDPMGTETLTHDADGFLTSTNWT